MQMGNGKKVYVGLSGGVDSSVSALLLKEQGYDVTGVFIKVWHPDFLKCDWKAEMRDAMRVCAKLDIPFIKLDLEDQYKTNVIDYMIGEYKKGRTPNPDVMCNKHVKFGSFFDFAIASGADFVATGHYADIEESGGKFRLIEPKDSHKDQTYFLWTLAQKQLSKTIFPIGKYSKDEVRKIAEKNNLFTHEKKDSQGLCFIGHVDMKDFLKKYIDTKPGEVQNENGEIIGHHDGALLYTIGQRHGFVITEKSDNEKPYYITKKDLDKNILKVSDAPASTEDTSTYKIESLQFTYERNQMDEINCKAQVRYNGEKTDVILKNDQVSFVGTQKSVTSGQSIVFYIDNECIGGAIIT